MKIRTYLTILFTIITATILFVYASTIILTAKENREKEFYSLLQKEAITKANLFLNAKVDANVLQNIYKNNRKILNEVEVAIYDTSFNLLYHDAVDIDYVKETPEMIKEIYQKGELRFYQGNWQVIGLHYVYNNNDYIITATAIDQYGFNKLYSLLKSSIIVFIFSILIIYVAGRYFSKKAFKPVKEMVEQVRTISATNLHLRLKSNNNKDELSELAETFNEMLSRLENSFEAQKQFVSNISHELRTPLSAIITELELTINHNKNADEYLVTIKNILNDAKKIVRLSNSLLDFAKASYDPTEISFKPIRIDEILLDASNQVQLANPNFKINISFENEIDFDDQIIVNGNEYLLKVAFANLLENACKFSMDKQCSVSISFDKQIIKVLFKDNGIGISDDDLHKIFTPFYRGANKHFAEGNGIGLSLTQKIINLHKGKISVNSMVNKGTTFQVEIPIIS